VFFWCDGFGGFFLRFFWPGVLGELEEGVDNDEIGEREE
jgi:hypothetical protein